MRYPKCCRQQEPVLLRTLRLWPSYEEGRPTPYRRYTLRYEAAMSEMRQDGVPPFRQFETAHEIQDLQANASMSEIRELCEVTGETGQTAGVDTNTPRRGLLSPTKRNLPLFPPASRDHPVNAPAACLPCC